MMLIDFSPGKDQQVPANGQTALEKAHSAPAGQSESGADKFAPLVNWISDSDNQWRPISSQSSAQVSQSSQPKQQPQQSAAGSEQTTSSPPPPATVNVQIYNTHGAEGGAGGQASASASSSEQQRQEMLEDGLMEYPDDGGDEAAASFVEPAPIEFDAAAASQQYNYRARPLLVDAGINSAAVGETVGERNSATGGALVLPGESESTNRLVQRVIDELERSPTGELLQASVKKSPLAD